MRRKKTVVKSEQAPNNKKIIALAATTINSITLSPDLSTLYLIDNGRAIAFNLKNKNGILIGMLDGQLSVVTAPPVVITENEVSPEDEPDNPNEPVDVEDDPIKRVAKRPRLLKLPAKKAYWTLMFIDRKKSVSIIGALEIDISIIGALEIDISLTGADPSASASARSSADTAAEDKCKMYTFDISKEPIILQRVGKQLVIKY